MLAAGEGGRLGERTSTLPKPLVTLNGRPILEYTLEALASVGVAELVVVVGYREEQVRRLFARHQAGLDVTLVSNSRYRRGASYSLQAAREATRDQPFLLVMSDHVLGPELLQRLLSAQGETCLVAADFDPAHEPAYLQEATKLAVDGEGHVTGIGKDLPRWDALDTGAFSCTAEIWEAAARAPEDCDLSTVFRVLARERRLRAADVSGCFWYDIDTDADLRAAGGLLAAANGGL